MPISFYLLQHQLSLNDITCVQCTSEPGSPRLSLYIPDGTTPDVVHLQFSSDTEMEEWQNHLATVCGQLEEAQGKYWLLFIIFLLKNT